MNDRSARASAPGKIILSGEHAVVHGAPALVTAVRRRAHATVTAVDPPMVHICLSNLEVTRELTMEDVRSAGASVAGRYQAFLKDNLHIDAVLQDAGELVQLCLLAHAGHRGEDQAGGLQIKVVSDIPLGRGMGSSAAVIIASLHALAASCGEPLSTARLVELAQEVEKYQHGHPSGADAHACAHGGTFLFRRGEEVQSLSLDWGPMFLVDTGKPVSQTGECVEAVRRRFEGDVIWKEFKKVTLALQSVPRGRHDETAALIRTNHELLVRIGVVPERVAGFIDALHQQGHAAKICGAGAVRGDQAGMVLVYGERPPEALCAEAGYTWFPLEPDKDGVTIDS